MDDLRRILRQEVNSAVLTFENHNTDNGFMVSNLTMMSRMLKRNDYEPVGICKNVPYNPHPTEQVAFVYRYDGELYWCHMPALSLKNLTDIGT